MFINYAITFIEGWTFEQWLDHFSSNTHFRNFDFSDVDALLDRTGFDKGDPEDGSSRIRIIIPQHQSHLIFSKLPF